VPETEDIIIDGPTGRKMLGSFAALTIMFVLIVEEAWISTERRVAMVG